MADPRKRGLEALSRAQRVLDLYRKSIDHEVKRTVALMQADVLEEAADRLLDEIPDGDIGAVMEERRRMMALRDEHIEEAARQERLIMEVKWDMANTDPRRLTGDSAA